MLGALFLLILLQLVTSRLNSHAGYASITTFKKSAVKPDVISFRAGATEDEEDEYIPPSEHEEDSANIQFMITNKMRYVLEAELGYLPEEVDEMEPQIAALVISKNLARPSKGMPDSWRRPDPSIPPPRNIIGEIVGSIYKAILRLQAAVGSLVTGAKTVALPITATSLAVVLIIKIKNSGIKLRLPSLPSIDFSFLTRRSSGPSKSKEVKQKKYNLKYLEKLHSPSIVDSLVVKSKTIGKK